MDVYFHKCVYSLDRLHTHIQTNTLIPRRMFVRLQTKKDDDDYIFLRSRGISIGGGGSSVDPKR